MSIVPFSSVSDNNLSLLGGKASSLVTLTQNGFNIPNGFVISTDEFRGFLEYNNIKQTIDSLIANLCVSDIKRVELISKEIQGVCTKTTILEDISEKIIAQFDALNVGYVAVRSSANVEDSRSNAWAGQFETYLYTTKDDLIDNIKKCWQSLYTTKALMYRARNHMIDTDIAVAVIVQEMVDSQISGIGFSINPVNNDKNNIIIEAGFGLGESIVSGLITPDTYIVDKRNNYISKKINCQTKAIYKSGIKTISKQTGTKQKLTDMQIIEVSQSIKKIEEIYSYPVDIEFAYYGDKFYLLQARPITTSLGSIDTKAKVDKEIMNYIRARTWGVFKNTKRYLLPASMWVHGIRNPIKEIIDKIEVEDIEVNTVSNRTLRCFNVYTGALTKKHLPNSSLIMKHIGDNYSIVKEAENILNKIDNQIKNSDYDNIIKNALSFIGLYDKISFYECYINGLINVLHQHKDDFDNTEEVLATANKWRNDEFMEHLFCKFLNVVDYLLARKQLKIEVSELAKYLHINDFIRLLNNEISNQELMDIIKRRKTHGYILLNLAYPQYQNIVLDSTTGTKEVEDFIYSVHANVTRQQFNGVELKGESTFKSNDSVRGECVIINQEQDLSSDVNLDNKILVTTMTTPNFLPYINGVKGIITDNGGLICHAAIISREYKIPCIIGTEAATSIYKTGDLVEMNLIDGVIKKI